MAIDKRILLKKQLLLSLWLGLSVGLIGWSLAQTLGQLINDEMLNKAKALYGQQIEPVLLGWGRLVLDAKNNGQNGPGSTVNQEQQTLQRINQYFNKHIRFVSDHEHWQKEDYWATPLESLGTSGGDCEDFVVAKYFSLIQAGIAEQKLRIMYVKAMKLNQAHMVLAYYATAKSEPLILDNLIPQIKKASLRRDLSPVYSFNGAGLWLERMRGSSIKVGDANGLDMWVDVLRRMDEQGLSAWLNLNNQPEISPKDIFKQ